MESTTFSSARPRYGSCALSLPDRRDSQADVRAFPLGTASGPVNRCLYRPEQRLWQIQLDHDGRSVVDIFEGWCSASMPTIGLDGPEPLTNSSPVLPCSGGLVLVDTVSHKMLHSCPPTAHRRHKNRKEPTFLHWLNVSQRLMGDRISSWNIGQLSWRYSADAQEPRAMSEPGMFSLCFGHGPSLKSLDLAPNKGIIFLELSLGRHYSYRHRHRSHAVAPRRSSVLDGCHVLQTEMPSRPGLLLPTAAHHSLGPSLRTCHTISVLCRASVCRYEQYPFPSGHGALVLHIRHDPQSEELHEVLLHRHGATRFVRYYWLRIRQHVRHAFDV